MFTFELKNSRYSLKLPVLTLGTANFERQDNDEKYFELLDRYVELGGTCLDTARCYCDWVEGGHNASESVIGRWLEKNNCRDKIIISTKGGHPAMDDMKTSRLSPEELRYDLEHSLECLKTDYIDIYFLHRDDESIPVSEIMPVLNEFAESGKVHFLGASNWTSKRIEEANKFAEENGMEPFRVSQINFSLAHASTDTYGDDTVVCMDLREYKWYQRHQFPVMASTP
ncbi:MAG: aldo/keto reductase, partial [Oscillospiraceae bacterium]